MTVDQAYQLALQQHQAGNIDKAHALYEQILAVDPRHAESLHLLGVIATQRAEYPRAVELIGRAITLNPSAAHYHSNLGEVHRRAGQLEHAVAACRRSLALHEPFADAYLNLGLALNALGRSEEARAAFQRLTELAPGKAHAHANLGEALTRLGQKPAAIAAYQRALALDPACVLALNNLGNIHVEEGRLDDAHNAYHAAAVADPRDIIALQNLGSLLFRRRSFAAARQIYEHFLREHPANLEAVRGLANVLRETCHNDESIALYRKAVALAPNDCYLRANLAASLRDSGYPDEALAEFKRALELGPNEPAIHSSFILTQYLLPGVTQAHIDAEKRRWNHRHALPRAPLAPVFANIPDPARPLRVGYVSPDLRIHPVGRFMLPLLRAHDPAQVRVTCYSTTPAQDGYTAAIRAATERTGGDWRIVDTRGDEDLAALIRADHIDILVDLSMHAVGNRLLAFARRPAPVQLSYLAYADGAGLDMIDAHLTDVSLEPPGARDASPHDRPVRLAHTYWCYAPHAAAPPVGPLPALSGRPFTFGCLNHFGKVTAPAIAAWADLLRATSHGQGSRLLLHVPPGDSRALIHRRFAAANIPADRVEFLPTSSLEEYLAFHHQLDVALDPFPYVGGTTTCDSLWMGVPVVSLAGPPDAPATSRSGLSILTAIGLPHLAAQSVDQYLAAAAALTTDLPALAALRSSLRQRLQSSPLTDITAFAHDIESAYRTLWQNWCATPST